jgi:hypothetical protein
MRSIVLVFVGDGHRAGGAWSLPRTRCRDRDTRVPSRLRSREAERDRTWLKGDVDKGRIPGAVVLIAASSSCKAPPSAPPITPNCARWSTAR